MNLEDLPPAELMWEGKFVRALRRGKWEYASRARDIRAVVILAEHEDKVILVEQPRVAPDCRCIELPAGLVGDTDPSATVESTAVKELEEETGFTAERVERLGDFYSSPGMLAEARRTGLYARLHEGDLRDVLRAEPPSSADLAVAADVFIYLRAIGPVLRDCAQVLAPGGLFAFTVQGHPGARGTVLGADGRYAHGVADLRDDAAAAGLKGRQAAPHSP